MKKTIATLVVTAATLGFGGNAFAQAQGQGGLTFQISNQQSESLGQVTVSTVSGDAYVNVPDSSVDSVIISDTATSITICGQIVLQGQTTYVALPDQTIIGVVWQNPCQVIVLDRDEIE